MHRVVFLVPHVFLDCRLFAGSLLGRGRHGGIMRGKICSEGTASRCEHTYYVSCNASPRTFLLSFLFSNLWLMYNRSGGSDILFIDEIKYGAACDVFAPLSDLSATGHALARPRLRSSHHPVVSASDVNICTKLMYKC